MENEKKVEKYKEIRENGLEIVLQSLALANKKYETLKSIGDLSGSEIIENEFFKKYERLYLALYDEKFLENCSENLEGIEKILSDIMIKNGLTDDYIKAQREKRKKLIGISGSEVVRRFFEYQLKELKSKRGTLLREADEILKKEFAVNERLSNSIQQEEQMEIIYELHPLREAFRKIDATLVELEKKIGIIEDKLDKKWYYEIFGTTEEAELKGVYNKVF